MEPRFNKVPRDWENLNREFVISRFVFHIFYRDLISLGGRISIILLRTSLYRGSLNRGSTAAIYRILYLTYQMKLL